MGTKMKYEQKDLIRMIELAYSLLPDRPMAPGAKMTGGDKPCWDADMEYWLTCGDSISSHPRYKSSGGAKSAACSG